MSNNLSKITPDEWLEWQNHPVTQLYRAYLANMYEVRKEQWASGAFSGGSMEQAVMRSAEALGEVGLLQQLLSLTLDEVKEDLSNEQHR